MIMAKRNLKLVIFEGICANLLFGTLFVWSILRNPLLELFPTWTDGMLSLIFGLHNLFTCAGILIGGQLCKRMSTRRVFCIFTGMSVIGLAGFAALPVNNPSFAYVLAFVLFCFFAATGIGIGINVVQSTTIPWFPNNSGAISGALYMALGISSVILAAIAQWLLPTLGVKLVMPVFAVIILTVSAVILCDKNGIMAPNAGSDTDTQRTGFRPSEMIRMPSFWALVLWNICLRTSGLILLDHAASIAAALGGAALTAMLIAPANGLGSISVGFAMDKLGGYRIMRMDALLMLLAAGLLCVGIFTDVYLPVFIGLILGGFAYGGSSSSYAASVKNCYGTKYYTQNFAISNLAMGCAALLESTSGTVLDVSGGYFMVVLMVLGFAAIACMMALLTHRVRL